MESKIIHRGDIWWANLPEPNGPHHVVILSNDFSIDVKESVTVAQVTSTIRGNATEVQIGPEVNLDHNSVINCDEILTILKSRLKEKRGSLSINKLKELKEALDFALDLY